MKLLWWFIGIWLLVWFLAYAPWPAWGQEVQPDDGGVVDTSRDLTECAGFYYASEDLAREVGLPEDDAALAHDVGNGAVVAASWLLVLLDIMTPKEAMEYIQGNAERTRAHWRSRFTDLNNPVIAEWRDRCVKLNPLQTELVQQAMRFALTNRPKQEQESD